MIADPLSIYLPVVIEHGEGATLTDVDGNTFIDFTGGVGCLNVGHAHPHVVEAVQEQAAKFFHTDFTIVPYEVYVDARRAARRHRADLRRRRRPRSSTPARRPSRTRSSSRAPTRSGPAVIGFEGGFHGRTLLSLTLTSKTHPYKAGLGPVRAGGLPASVRAGLPRAERRRRARSARAGADHAPSPPRASPRS